MMKYLTCCVRVPIANRTVNTVEYTNSVDYCVLMCPHGAFASIALMKKCAESNKPRKYSIIGTTSALSAQHFYGRKILTGDDMVFWSGSIVTGSIVTLSLRILSMWASVREWQTCYLLEHLRCTGQGEIDVMCPDTNLHSLALDLSQEDHMIQHQRARAYGTRTISSTTISIRGTNKLSQRFVQFDLSGGSR